jgi:hypothetical protein
VAQALLLSLPPSARISKKSVENTSGDEVKQRKDADQDLSANAQALLDSLATTGHAVRLASLTGGLDDLTSQWARHVEEAEDVWFPRLVAGGPEADGPVGFCLAEHAALTARLAELAATRPTPEWLREAELLIGRLIQHLFIEARIVQPLLDRTASEAATDRADQHLQRRGKP